MFSHWYATKDAALMKGGTTEQLDYAMELLAEVLNRSRALGNLYLMVYERKLARGDEPGNETDYLDSVDTLMHSLGIFTQDMDEALTRARRAGLVYGADGTADIHTGSVDDGVDEIGGTLVPWDEDQQDLAVRRAGAGAS
jgi:hypothetical protein